VRWCDSASTFEPIPPLLRLQWTAAIMKTRFMSRTTRAGSSDAVAAVQAGHSTNNRGPYTSILVADMDIHNMAPNDTTQDRRRPSRRLTPHLHTRHHPLNNTYPAAGQVPW